MPAHGPRVPRIRKPRKVHRAYHSDKTAGIDLRAPASVLFGNNGSTTCR